MSVPARSRASIAPHVVLRLALFVAVFASAVLMVDYMNAGDPAFCGAGSGCMAVRRSDFSHVGNAPLPGLGLVAELSLLLVTVAARDAAATLVSAVAAGLGGLIAIGLIAVQAFVIEAFCKWCLIVDSSAIIAAVAAALAYRDARKNPSEPPLGAASKTRVAASWLAGAALAVVLPFVWGAFPVVPPLPPQIAARAVPGKLTMVTFTDFECPFCRRLSPALHAIVAENPDHVALVRLMAPLGIHPGARPAAIGYLCAPEDRRETFATALYLQAPERLTESGIKALAKELGLDEAAFATCTGALPARQQIADDTGLFEALHLEGLPYTYVGRRAVVGANLDALANAVEEGLAGPRPELPVAALLALMALVAAALCAWTARLAQSPAEEPRA